MYVLLVHGNIPADPRDKNIHTSVSRPEMRFSVLSSGEIFGSPLPQIPILEGEFFSVYDWQGTQQKQYVCVAMQP
jgi:hypothetical protein